MLSRVIPLKDIIKDSKHYLFHKDDSRPEPFVNVYAKVIYQDDEIVILRKASNEYFIDHEGNQYDHITFKKYFYNKLWYLSK